ncbi:ISAon1 family transposase N-terminal region protein [Nafulsella turpanensis]
MFPPSELTGQRLGSEEFYDEISLSDFPIRGKLCYLKVRRRRWLNEDGGKVVSRDRQSIAQGTRRTKELPSF